MTEMSTSEVLNKAADLIEQHGWGRGPDTWEDNGSGLCLEGGIIAALGGEYQWGTEGFRECPAYRAVQSHLRLDDELWEWNDTDDRAAEDVIGVLRATALIEAARERESVEV